jgi:hypothetical protein
LFGAVSYAVCNFALLTIVTRGLGAAGAGAFLQAIRIFAILNITAVLGTETGLIRSITRARAHGRARDITPTLWVALVPVFLVSSAFAAVLLLYTPQIATLLGEGQQADDIAAYTRVMAPFLPLSAVYIAVLGATRGFGRMRPTVLLDKVEELAREAGMVAELFLRRLVVVQDDQHLDAVTQGQGDLAQRGAQVRAGDFEDPQALQGSRHHRSSPGRGVAVSPQTITNGGRWSLTPARTHGRDAATGPTTTSAARIAGAACRSCERR